MFPCSFTSSPLPQGRCGACGVQQHQPSPLEVLLVTHNLQQDPKGGTQAPKDGSLQGTWQPTSQPLGQEQLDTKVLLPEQDLGVTCPWLSARAPPRYALRAPPLTKGLVDRQVGLDHKHGGAGHLGLLKDVATFPVQHTVDAANHLLWALQERGQDCKYPPAFAACRLFRASGLSFLLTWISTR